MAGQAAIRSSAVAVILGSALILLLSLGMIAGLLLAPLRDTSALPPVVLRVAGVLVFLLFSGFSVWGIATGAAIFRRRAWARISMLIFAGLLLFFGATGVLIMLFAPLPAAGDADPHAAETVRRTLAAFYGVIALAGSWWLLLFGGRQARVYFAENGTAAAARPLSISVIGWWLLAGAALSAINVALRMPVLHFGWLSTGWTAMGVWSAYAAAQVYLGSGLLQLDSRARVWAIVFFAFAGANGLTTLWLPENPQRTEAIQKQLEGVFRIANIPQFSMPWLGAILCVVAVTVPVWFPIRRRAAFSN